MADTKKAAHKHQYGTTPTSKASSSKGRIGPGAKIVKVTAGDGKGNKFGWFENRSTSGRTKGGK